MSIEATLTTAFAAVLANTWAVELPARPTWPAAVFSVETEVEDQWSTGSERPVYEQHVVDVAILGRDVDALITLRDQFRTAAEALPEYMGEEDSGDADYEPDPKVHGKAVTFRFRTRRTGT